MYRRGSSPFAYGRTSSKNLSYESPYKDSTINLSPSISSQLPMRRHVFFALSLTRSIQEGTFKYSPLNSCFFICAYRPCVSAKRAYALSYSIPASFKHLDNVSRVLGRNSKTFLLNTGVFSSITKILVLFSIATISSA